ncbi:MAG: DUF2240 family protein [Thermoplasmata archaeon]|nr:DUF2240 family protein [Thermoplasmata archaeon]
MTGDLELCAAAFFRTVGKDVATTDEFVMEVSLGQKWMSPSEAKDLLKALVSAGVLEQRDGYLRPKADLSGIDVPLAYRPPKDLAKAPKKDVPAPSPKQDDGDMFPKLMDVAAGAGVQRREFIQECNRIQKRLDVDICAAALIVLRDSGVDISPYVEGVYGRISSSRVTPS